MKEINAIVQLSGGTQAEWNLTVVPIPAGVLAYAIDTKVIKRGDGVTLFKDLDVYLDLTTIEQVKQFKDSFPEPTGQMANKLIVVNNNGTGYIVSSMGITDMVLKTELASLLTDKANVVHTHSAGDVVGLGTAALRNTGVSPGQVPLINTDGKLNSSIVPPIVADNLAQEDILSYLLTSQLAADDGVKLNLPDGIADTFEDETGIDADLSVNEVYDGVNEQYEGIDMELVSTAEEVDVVPVSARLYINTIGDGVPNKNIFGEVSRDDGVTWAMVPIERQRMSVDPIDVYAGTTNFDKTFALETVDLTTAVIDDVKGSITTFVVDTENISGHFNVALSTDYIGYHINITGEESLIITDIVDSGTTANDVKFTGTLSAGTYTVASIKGMYITEDNKLSSVVSEVVSATEGSFWQSITPENLNGAKCVTINGIGYILGGYDEHNELTGNLFAFNPVNKTTVKLSSPIVPRRDHGLVNIEHMLYVIGGMSSGGPVDDLWSYNTLTDVWTELTRPGVAIYGHAAAAVDGNIFIAGGYVNPNIFTAVTTVKKYIPQTDTWSTVAVMPEALAEVQAVSQTNKMLVYGGYGTMATPTRTSKSSTISVGTRTPTIIFNNKLYMASSSTGILYEWSGSTWEERAPIYTGVSAESSITGLVVHNNKLYAITANNGNLIEWNGSNAWVGRASEYGGDTILGSVCVFNGKIYAGVTGGSTDPGKLLEWNGVNAWEQKAGQYGSETHIYSLVVYNNKLYGGTYPSNKLLEWNGVSAWVEKASQYGGEGGTYELCIYNNKLYCSTGSGALLMWNGTNAWVHQAAAYGTESSFYNLTVYNNKLYASTRNNGRLLEWNGTSWSELLGSTIGNIASAIVYNNEYYEVATTGQLFHTKFKESPLLQYVPTTNTWSTLTNIPGKVKVQHAMALIDGKVYVHGGKDYTAPTTNVYDIAGNSWTTVNSTITRANHTTMQIVDDMYVYGGNTVVNPVITGTQAAPGTIGTNQEPAAIVSLDGSLYCAVRASGTLLKWNGTNAWTQVAPSLGANYTTFYSAVIFNGKIYTSSNGELLEWNDIDAWVVKAPTYGSETVINSLVVYNNKLYGGTSSLGKLLEWNGTNAWVEKAAQYGTELQIMTLCVYNNKLYGGSYPTGKLLEWNGVNAWVEKAPMYLTDTYIRSLVVFNNKLYAGTGQGRLLAWNGTNAWVLESDVFGSESQTKNLTVYNNEIYAITNNYNVLKWNGTDAWIITSIIGLTLQRAGAIGIHNDKLYIARYNQNSELYELAFKYFSTVEVYNTTDNTWMDFTPDTRLIPNRNISGVTTYDSEIYLYGGKLGDTVSAEMYKHNPATNVTTQLGDGPVAIGGNKMSVVGTKLYSVGGVGGLLESTSWVQKAPTLSGATVIFSTCIFNNKIYGGTNDGRLVEWNGTDVWVPKASLISSNSYIYALCVFNNKLYAGTNAGQLFEWNGTDAWIDKASQYASEVNIRSLCVFNNKLYAGTGNLGNLLEWNGSNAWTQRAIQYASEDNIYSLVVYNNKLYGGSGSTGYLLEWNGTNAWVLKAGQYDAQTYIRTMCVFNNKLYAGTASGGRLLEWNGTNAWVEKAPQYGSSNQIYSIQVFNNTLYAGVAIGLLLKWNGTDAWVEKAPVYGSEGTIYSLVIYNSKIYGSTGGGKLLECSIYDTTSKTIEYIPSTGSYASYTNLLPERQGHSLTSVSTKMYVFGGTDSYNYYDDFWEYNTVNNTWTQLTGHNPKPSARANHGATMYNDKIYIYGGNDATTVFRDLWEYDPLTNLFVLITSSVDTCLYPSMSNIADMLYVYGKQEASSYTGWKLKAYTLSGQSEFNGLVIFNNKLYGAGASGKLLEWNGTDAWVEKAPIYGSESTIYSLCVYNNKLYGGTGSTGLLLEWNGTNAWILKAGQASGQTQIKSLCVYNNKLYGGTAAGGRLLEWNGTDAWIEKAAQYSGQANVHSLCVYNNKLYGGTGSTGLLLEWNGTNAWILKAGQYGSEINIHSLCVFNNKLYGGSQSGCLLLEWNDVDAWVLKGIAGGTDQSLINSLVVYNNELYIATGNLGKIYKWDGVNTLNQVLDPPESSIYLKPLCVFNNKLYGCTHSTGKLVEYADAPNEDVLLSYNVTDDVWEEAATNMTAKDTSTLVNVDDKLYAHGSVVNTNVISSFSSWKTTQVAPQFSDQITVLNLVDFNNKIYGVTSGSYLLEWNGTNAWVQKANPNYLTNTGAMVVYNNKIYISNETTYATRLFEWDGISTWVEKGVTSIDEINHSITSLIVYDSKLYGILSYGASATYGSLMEWNGTNAWVKKANMYGSEYTVHCLCVFNNKIYGGGGNTGSLLEWNGVDAWVQKAPQYGPETVIYELIVYNNQLYGGTGRGSLLKWNGTNAWVEVAPQYSTQTQTIKRLRIFNNKLYGATLSGYILEWNGSNAWVQKVPKYDTASIYGLLIYNNKLYSSTSYPGALLEYSIEGTDSSTTTTTVTNSIEMYAPVSVIVEFILKAATATIPWTTTTLTAAYGTTTAPLIHCAVLFGTQYKVLVDRAWIPIAKNDAGTWKYLDDTQVWVAADANTAISAISSAFEYSTNKIFTFSDLENIRATDIGLEECSALAVNFNAGNISELTLGTLVDAVIPEGTSVRYKISSTDSTSLIVTGVRLRW